jgi:hypothetical protein
MYIHTDVYTYMGIHTHAHTYTCTYRNMYLNMHMYRHIKIHAQTFKYTYMYIHIQVHVYSYTYIDMHIHVNSFMYSRKYTRTCIRIWILMQIHNMYKTCSLMPITSPWPLSYRTSEAKRRAESEYWTLRGIDQKVSVEMNTHPWMTSPAHPLATTPPPLLYRSNKLKGGRERA